MVSLCLEVGEGGGDEGADGMLLLRQPTSFGTAEHTRTELQTRRVLLWRHGVRHAAKMNNSWRDLSVFFEEYDLFAESLLFDVIHHMDFIPGSYKYTKAHFTQTFKNIPGPGTCLYLTGGFTQIIEKIPEYTMILSCCMRHSS